MISQNCHFCRFCLSWVASHHTLCPFCSKAGFLPPHQELYKLNIAHLDCDAFYAAVEQADNPHYKNEILIIGHGKRGVVCTACYKARSYGIKAAMPLKEALRRCPKALVIKPNMARYKEVSHALQQRMLTLTPLVEPISIDEAFLDLSGTTKLHKAPPAVMLAKFVHQIKQDFGISISVGLSYCKFLAKIASGLEKPYGFSVIGKKEAIMRLDVEPVEILWGVGSKIKAKLNQDGIYYCADLRKQDLKRLVQNYGKLGQRLYDMAHGQDKRKVIANPSHKSFSLEVTFEEDIQDKEILLTYLKDFAEGLSQNLKKQTLLARQISVKLRKANFQTQHKALTLDNPIQQPYKIFKIASILLEKLYHNDRYRLIGLSVKQFEKQKENLDLFADEENADKVEALFDNLRRKFGQKAIITGTKLLNSPKKD